jgi:hypothetical protein
LEEDLDKFLRDVIQIAEKVKETQFAQIDSYTTNFMNYYANMSVRVEEFLKGSIALIKK